MKFFLSASLAILSTSAVFASFEMALLIESGSSEIRRVDPENRVILGSFGASRLLNPRAIAVDQANNNAYVLNEYGNGFGRITVLNYNTGEYVREWSLGVSGLAGINSMTFRPGTGLYVPLKTRVALFTTGASEIASYSGVGFTDIRSVSYSSGFVEVYAHNFGGQTIHYNANSLGSVNGTVATGLVPGQTGFSAVNSAQSFGGSGQNLVNFNHSGLFGSVSGPAYTAFNSIQAVRAAHGDSMYVAGFTSTGGSGIMTFNQNGLQTSGMWTVPGGNGILSMATVVAPEPGTMIALSVGLAAIARRRKANKAA
jgi:hypothetical protein